MTTQTEKDLLIEGIEKLQEMQRDLLAAVPVLHDLKADLEQALGLIAGVEADFQEGGYDCLTCHEYADDGHHPDCLWANLLTKYGREVRYAD